MGRGFAAVMLGGLLLAQAGCGQGLYEERLRRSEGLFRYMQTLSENLATDVPLEHGVSLRPPLGYVAIEPPKDETDPKDTTKASKKKAVVDPRQPPYVNVEFPGLLATFSKKVDYYEKEPVNEQAAPPIKQGDCFIYVMSSAALPRNDDGKTASAGYSDTVIEKLTAALRAKPDEKSIALKCPEVNPLPGDNKLFRINEFNQRTIEPSIRVNNIDMTFQTYRHRTDGAEILIIVGYPRYIVNNERLEERTKLALATLRYDSQSGRTVIPGGGSKSSGTKF